MLIRFVLIAFVWSWSFWIPGTLAERGAITLPIPAGLLEILGTFGPFVAAVVLVAQEKGRAGVGALFRRAVRGRLSPVWYLVALGGPFLYHFATMAIHVALGGAAPDMNEVVELLPGILVNFVINFLIIGTGEEFGWRGYALPRLQRQGDAVIASLILGVIWALWHLPQFFNPATSYSAVNFPAWMLFLLPYSILHTWLYNSTRGSLLMAMMLHGMVNVTGGLWRAVPDVGPLLQTTPGLLDYIYRLDSIVLWILAILVVVTVGRENLSRQPRQVG
jgi:membrane protease YdiL (CAAX protease family)